jgi:hypothetical protein
MILALYLLQLVSQHVLVLQFSCREPLLLGAMASVHQLLMRLNHVLPYAGVLMICFQGKEKGVWDGGKKSKKGIVLIDRKTGIVQRTEDKPREVEKFRGQQN